MNIIELGAIGELVGGVAVLATLIYLAAQVRQGNTIVKSQVEHETSRRSSELAIMLADPAHRDLAFRALEDFEHLSAGEGFSVMMRWLAFLNYYETLFYARERGEIDDDLWESRVERMRWTFAIVPRRFWEERRLGFGKRFRAFVETEIRSVAGGALA